MTNEDLIQYLKEYVADVANIEKPSNLDVFHTIQKIDKQYYSLKRVIEKALFDETSCKPKCKIKAMLTNHFSENFDDNSTFNRRAEDKNKVLLPTGILPRRNGING